MIFSATYGFSFPEISRLGKYKHHEYYAYSGNVLLQEKVFGRLISLFRTENVEIRNATRDALLRINVCIDIPFFLFWYKEKYIFKNPFHPVDEICIYVLILISIYMLKSLAGYFS